MMRLAIFTSARSDFGPMTPLLRLASRVCEVDLLVGGAHFTSDQTLGEVKALAEELSIKVISLNFMEKGESPLSQAKSLAAGQAAMGELFAREAYDVLVLMGDRWELFAASLPAFLAGLPIAHISGGEVTEGVIDDSIRHAHSKLAHLHFVATETYAENLSRMGEEDWRITVSGECGLDSIHSGQVAPPEEVLERFDLDIGQPVLLVTFHPATLEHELEPADQVEGLLNALQRMPDVPIVITAPGKEQGAEVIRARLIEFAASHSNARFVSHLGSRCYLAVLRSAGAVVGNSSSGLVEAASFGVPAVNIGNRQRNRLAAESVLHVGYGADVIEAAIRKALDPAFQAFSKACVNPYDPYRDGRNSERILHALLRALETQPRSRLLGKRFVLDKHPGEWNTFLKDFR